MSSRMCRGNKISLTLFGASSPDYHPWTRSDTNQPVQSQKKARILKFWEQVEEEWYCLCSKSTGTDHLCIIYCTADLRLVLHMQIVGFLMERLI